MLAYYYIKFWMAHSISNLCVLYFSMTTPLDTILCMIVLWYCHFVGLTVAGSLLYPPQLLYGIYSLDNTIVSAESLVSA